MIFTLLRIMFFGFLALSVVYFLVSYYFRSGTRAALGREWDEEVKTGDRADYIEAGLKEYEGSLRRKLILGVYIVPLIVLLATLYMVNFM